MPMNSDREGSPYSPAVTITPASSPASVMTVRGPRFRPVRNRSTVTITRIVAASMTSGQTALKLPRFVAIAFSMASATKSKPPWGIPWQGL